MRFYFHPLADKEFDEAVFALEKVGDLSPVFKDARGFHIVQLEKKEPAELRDYDRVEKTIERKIINERRRAEYDSYIEELKQRIGYTINEDLLADESTDEGAAEDKPVSERIERPDGLIELKPVGSGEDEK